MRAIRYGHSVGARGQEDGNNAARLSIKTRRLVIAEGSQFDPRHVFQPYHRPVGIFAHNDVSELLRRHQPSLRADGVSHRRSWRSRITGKLPGWIYRVLLIQRVD